MKRIVILGSTGSIGESTLDIARHNPDKIKVVGLSTKGNLELLGRQIDEFRPEAVAVWDTEKAKRIEGIKVYSGIEGLLELIRKTEADLVVSAMVGAIGLRPTLEAIRSGKDVALANKEVLIMAGPLVMDEVKKCGVELIPIDSEHSALWQCLTGRGDREEVKRIIITASGGPFYHNKELDLTKVSPDEALAHPRWQMGPKVTVDSATLMNKGFEVIEASYLFGIPLDRIEVVIHPESIVHAMVEFIDGSVIAHMHIPDMRIPIQYALSVSSRCPTSRWEACFGRLDLTEVGSLNFSKPDTMRFPALRLAYEAGYIGGTMPVVLSASDEVCVEKFLSKDIGFMDIPSIVERVMQRHRAMPKPSIDEILDVDNWARRETLNECKKIKVPT